MRRSIAFEKWYLAPEQAEQGAFVEVLPRSTRCSHRQVPCFPCQECYRRFGWRAFIPPFWEGTLYQSSRGGTTSRIFDPDRGVSANQQRRTANSSPTLFSSGLRTRALHLVMAGVIQNSHPFYPLEADIVGYLANGLSVSALLASFASGCALILGGTLVLLRLNKPLLRATDQAVVLWFMLSEYSWYLNLTD